MAKDDMDIVSAIRQRLAQRVGPERYDLWFGGSVQITCEGDVLTIAAPSDFMLDRLRTNFRYDLESACREATGRVFNLSFTSRGATRPEPRRRSGRPAKPADNASATATTTLHQPIRAGLDSFVLGDSNRLAHTSTQSVLANLGRFSPLFLSGPHGCGKTHLLQCLKQSARRRLQSARVVMMPAEQFTTLFLEALHGSGLPNFRRKYRDLDVLIIDDVQFFAGKRATLLELHHTIDSMQRNGRQLVFAADRPPNELHGLGQDLIARMTGGLVCRIDSLDVATRRAVLDMQAKQRGLRLPREVVDDIAQQLGGDARQLLGALNRLEVVSLAQRTPITPELAAECLQDIYRSQRRTIRLDDIEEAVCSVFGLDPDSLQSESKSRSVLQPRMLAMWLARKHTRAAYSEIGRYFGKRSHSTVISANRKVNRWLDENADVDSPTGPCGASDAVDRIEVRLRAGG